MGEKTIYELELHETCKAGVMTVMRVAGGWIYGTDTMMVFVPFDNMFMEKPKVDPDNLPF